MRELRARLVPLLRNRFHVADGRTNHRTEGSAVGTDEQDALGEQRRCRSVEGDDVVVAGHFTGPRFISEVDGRF